jgi:hypothetical protein
MHILYITYLGTTSSDYPLFLSQAWEKSGHTVDLLSYDIECLHEPFGNFINRLSFHNASLRYSQTRKKVMAHVKKKLPDIVIFSGDFFSGKLLLEIKTRYKCKVGFLLGYNNLLQNEVVESIRYSDFLIIHDTYFLPILQGDRYRQKKHVFYFPGMANPEIHRPLSLNPEQFDKYNYDVVFVGGINGGKRQEYLESLTGFNFQIFGTGNSSVLKSFFNSEPIYGVRKSCLYNSAKIVLNIEEKQLNAINPRIPEVLACGGFIITDYSKDLDLFGFKDGESIVYFYSKDELNDKIKYYLSHEEERKKIAMNGKSIVLNNLTFDIVGNDLLRGFETVLQEK